MILFVWRHFVKLKRTSKETRGGCHRDSTINRRAHTARLLKATQGNNIKQKNSKTTKGLQGKTQDDLTEKKSVRFIVWILDGNDGSTIA